MKNFFLATFLAWNVAVEAGRNTISAPPIISSIYPRRGGTQGGTRLTITGYNFAQKGLFSSRTVLIGGGVCKVIDYYTTDGQIICITPVCSDPVCKSDVNQIGIYDVVANLAIYVQTFEGILGTSTTYTYSTTFFTPAVLRMSHYSWGSSTSSVMGFIGAAYLEDVSVTFGTDSGTTSSAFIGDSGELNSELWGNSNYKWYLSTNSIYYRPPVDMVGGAYNLSLVVQDNEMVGWANGAARTFPNQIPNGYYTTDFDYTYPYNYEASLSGTPHSMFLLPSISTISPAVGSVAGGTILTITGSGFSKNISRNVVYAGGERCNVISADFTTIQCSTSPISKTALDKYVSSVSSNSNGVPRFSAKNWTYSSRRSFGSSGFWMKMWDMRSYNKKLYLDSEVRLSYGFKQGLAFGFYPSLDANNWPQLTGYNAYSTYDSKQFVADYISVLVAPYTGFYTFSANGDDVVSVYGAKYTASSGFGAESLIISIPYYAGTGEYYSARSINKSPRVFLNRGSRYKLRFNLLNTGGPDYFSLAMKVDPSYDASSGYLVDGLAAMNGANNDLPAEVKLQEAATPLTFSDSFLHHQSFKDIQVISISANLVKEVQSISIWGILSGTFDIIIQNAVSTLKTPFSLSTSSTDIANNMKSAVQSANLPYIECAYFSVTKRTQVFPDSSTALFLSITFLQDNSVPFTMLELYTANLKGTSNLTYSIQRTQLHSTVAGGTFGIKYTNPNKLQQLSTVVPLGASAQTLRNALQAMSPELNVGVTYKVSGYQFTWLVTFTNPHGLVPTLILNTTNVIGDNVIGSVTKFQNGSDKSLWFDPIPAWLLEVPLLNVPGNSISSNVEVYVESDAGDASKAVCDGSGDAAYSATVMFKGNENFCSYIYSPNSTAIVSNFSLAGIDAVTTAISIYGSGFFLAGSTMASTVTVTIADHGCNVTYITDTTIYCVVSSVPWGTYAPVVNIPGYGNAVIATSSLLNFKQTIYSMYPKQGSFVGGQIITFQGRGFRPASKVMFGSAGVCEIISASSSVIICRAPAAYSTVTSQPTFVPTYMPTAQPTFTKPPTYTPSAVPTASPSVQPTISIIPSILPTYGPTTKPTSSPTKPSCAPTRAPTPTPQPSFTPTTRPTFEPTTKPTFSPSFEPTIRPTFLPSQIPTRVPTTEPTSKPTAQPTTSTPTFTPSQRPSYQPSVIPTYIPSLEPTMKPSVLPTIIPTRCPTTEPSTRPSAIPTFIPTFVPSSIKPSCEPSALPSRIPTTEPTVKPTFLPTFVPTRLPTAEPSSKPSATPTFIPTFIPTTTKPSIGPSCAPSRVPSFEPTTRPSIVPTMLPSRRPTAEPTVKPTISPSFVPSCRPSTEPTLKSTAKPSCRPSKLAVARRLNQAAPIYDLTTEIFIGNASVDSLYTYGAAVTPMIVSIFPSTISSAVSTNVTIVYSNIDTSTLTSQNVTVMIGEQSCVNLVLFSSSNTITCFLIRSSAFTAMSTQTVKVYFPGSGYASTSTLNVFPTVSRGFQISDINSAFGSVMGGNILSIKGFGFDPSKPTKHSVVLTAVGFNGLSDYDLLLQSLGFPIYTKIAPQQLINCSVITVNYTEITCLVPPHAVAYQNLTYSVSVTLNNINAACFSLNNCSYIQNVLNTPIITSSSIQSVSNAGEYTVSIQGTLLDRGALQIYVGAVKCVVSSVVSAISNGKAVQTVVFSTPSLVAGKWAIIGNVAGVGQTMSKATLTVSAVVTSTTFETNLGSYLGGTFFTISGYGFSPICSQNLILFTVSQYANKFFVANITEFQYCTTTTVIAQTPSLYTILSGPTLKILPTTPDVTLTSMTLTVVANSTADSRTIFTQSNFAYSIFYTPLIAPNVTSGVSGTAINFLVFSSFAAINIPNEITINKTVCRTVAKKSLPPFTKYNNKAYNFTVSVDCIAPSLPAASKAYGIQVYVKPVGYASLPYLRDTIPPSFTSIFNAFSLNPSIVSSSISGGSLLTVNGQGFPKDTVVNICDQVCSYDLATVAYGTLGCTIPARKTIQSVNELKTLNVAVDLIDTINGTYFGSSTINTANIVDSNVTSFVQINSKTCSISLQLPSGYFAQPYRMRFYPMLRFSQNFGGVVFEGSQNGGKTYQSLGSVSSKIHEGWNFIDAVNTTTQSWFNLFRFRAVENSKSYSKCSLAEIEFLGIMASKNTTCPVVVSSPSLKQSFSVGAVAYASLLTFTPVIRSVFPNNGTALGGDVVTLYGSRLETLLTNSIVVTFSGVPCNVIMANSTAIQCITGERHPEDIETSSISVLIPGKGFAIVSSSAKFLYIDKWSALTTWMNQEPPVDGDIVWVPDGQVILLDVDTPVLLFLLVEGALYFDRTKDLKMDASYIFVLGGYFEVGTHEEPFEKSAIITLHGDRYKTIEVPPIGSKVLAVADKGIPSTVFATGVHVSGRNHGQLEVHGSKRVRTWTKVNATAVAGTNWLITSETVDFKAGDSVILTGNEYVNCDLYSNCFGYEELIVQSNYDGHNVSFTTPLAYQHRSEILIIEGRTVDMRCEIGLLSRNVIIQGDENSDLQRFGVHTVAMMSGIFRIENTEVRRCGQAFNFGRYCTHSHKGGDMEGSYVKANSIHHSYQRAVTTHDTNNWEVRDNVAFDVQGHAYFVEDGVEQYNSLTGNLGIFIRKSSALLRSDHAPAIFWTSTPLNFWRDNVAAHSQAHGFWFELGGGAAPDPGEDPACPFSLQLGEFNNNTFHSNTNIGLRIYPGWTPLKSACDSSSAPDPQYLYNLLSYKNGGNGLFTKRHGDLHHINPTLIANGANEINFIKYQTVGYTTNPTVFNALLVGTLDPSFTSTTKLGKYAIFAPQGEYFFVKNATFVNYGTTPLFTGCNMCLSPEMMSQGGFTTRYQNLNFVNSTGRVKWSETKKEILWDLDGSLAGVADSMITRSYGSLLWPNDCTVLPSAQYSDSVRCGGVGSPVRIRRMQVENISPTQLLYTDLSIKSDVGTSSVYFLPLDSSGWVFPVVTGSNKAYTLDFAASGHIAARTSTLTLGRPAYLLQTINNSNIDESVIIRNNLSFSRKWDYNPYSFVVTYGKNAAYAPTNYSNLVNMGNSRYFNYVFDVLLTNKGSSAAVSNRFSVATQASLCPPTGCYVPPITLMTPLLWSDRSSWITNNYTLPKAGQSITIASNMWIIMDINPPKLGSIIVYGKLSFLSDAVNPLDLTLYAQSIAVWGSMEIVGANNGTFAGTATVVIYGIQGASPPVSMGTNFVGAKVIAVVGKLTAKGQSKVSTWTKLKSTVNAGSKVALVNGLLSWSVGDEVVFSPTGYYNSIGGLWKTTNGLGANSEIRTIVDIQTFSNGNYSQIMLNKNLNHTHLCTTVQGKSFCGAVGVLSRSIRFVSTDAENPKLSSYGFGANIEVVDVIVKNNPSRYGSANLLNVQFKNFGKLNSDHYAVAIKHVDYNHPPSSVIGCAFYNGYSMAARTTRTVKFVFNNNVAVGMYSGGVFVEAGTNSFSVVNNLLIATYQLPAVLTSSYPWVRPVATITVMSSKGVVSGNLVAGSDDQGYAIATAMFTRKSVPASQCSVTTTAGLQYSLKTLANNQTFFGNEAVGCKGGLSIVTTSSTESTESDCAIITNFIAWRNSYTGIMSVDTEANVIIANVVLAENHIGINLHFYKEATNVFSGLVGSTIIGSLSLNTSRCTDLPDSLWVQNKQCHGFTELDPLGLSTTCSSTISPLYRRVGLLIPQWTNKGRTCAIAKRFGGPTCDPLNTPDRLCEMPFDRRYGLPIDVVYAEQHIHNTGFYGFQTYAGSSSKCIPTNPLERSVAVATNPSQSDMQPSLIISGLKWDNTDVKSRISFDTVNSMACSDQPCSGENMVMMHDLDGSIGLSTSGYPQPGQLVYNNPLYVAPYPLCYEISNVYSKLFFCPKNSDPSQEFRQYTAVWRDFGPQIIQPIITERHFKGESINRTFASYGPIDDECAKRFYYSRFNLLIANSTKQSLRSTGTTPNEVLLRWDAPSVNNVAIIEIFYTTSYDVSALVSNDPYNGFVEGTNLFRYPRLTDPAGSYMRDPQRRIIAVTIRGGSNRFYRFRQAPSVAVTIRLSLDFATFSGNTFIANMATLLSVDRSRIKIVTVSKGSTIVNFRTLPSNLVASNADAVTLQVNEANFIRSRLQLQIIYGALERIFNTTLLDCVSVYSVPQLLKPYDPTVDYPANFSANFTQIRMDFAQKLLTTTSLIPSPTSQPSREPSRQPSRQPNISPSRQPSRQPIRFPTSQPSKDPSSQPSRQPRGVPTGQPVRFPSSQPSKQPNFKPTSQPSGQPISKPSSQPFRKPTAQPSAVPRGKPSMQPYRNPSGQPSRQPFQKPTSQPSNFPRGKPSSQPIKNPTSQPSRVPFSKPSSQPSKNPRSKPTLQPFRLPTSQPSKLPRSKPSNQPSRLPSTQPSSAPSISQAPITPIPTFAPTFSPSTRTPSLAPVSKAPSLAPVSKTPSLAPVSKIPTVLPTTSKPSLQPTTSKPSPQPNTNNPSIAPKTIIPTFKPTSIPSIKPVTISPTFKPTTLTPTSKPTTSTVSVKLTVKPTTTLKHQKQ